MGGGGGEATSNQDWPRPHLYIIYSILFHSIPSRSIPFYSILSYPIQFQSIPCYSILFSSIPFHSCSILFYSIPFYSILFYCILLYLYCITVLYYNVLPIINTKERNMWQQILNLFLSAVRDRPEPIEGWGWGGGGSLFM